MAALFTEGIMCRRHSGGSDRLCSLSTEELLEYRRGKETITLSGSILGLSIVCPLMDGPIS